MDDREIRKKGISRRTFLKGVPIGMLGAFAVGVFGSRMLSSSAKRRLPRFKKGSIFTPRDQDIS